MFFWYFDLVIGVNQSRTCGSPLDCILYDLSCTSS
jgi:hypothetical protein